MCAKVKETSRSPRRDRAQRTREPGRTTISSKNQITIPVEVLRATGYGPGTRLEVSVNDLGEIVLRDAEETPAEKAGRLAGSLSGYYYPGYLEELRAE